MQIPYLTITGVSGVVFHKASASDAPYYRFVYETGVSGNRFVTCPFSSGVTMSRYPMYCDNALTGVQAFASGLGLSGVV